MSNLRLREIEVISLVSGEHNTQIQALYLQVQGQWTILPMFPLTSAGQSPTFSLNMICIQHLFFLVLIWLPRKRLPCNPTCVNATQPPDLTQMCLPQGLVQSPSQNDLLCPLISLYFLFPLQILSNTTWNGYLCLCLFFLISYKEVFEVKVRVNFWIRISPIVPWIHFKNIYWIASQRDFVRNNPF